MKRALCGLALLTALAWGQAHTDLKFPPLRQVQLPKVAAFTLANGMKLYLLENHELPLVSGLALVRTGNLFDPPEKTGLAQITGAVLRMGGTESKTGDELDLELENVAAAVESSIGESSGQVQFSALKENAGEVLAVFKDVLTAPEFRQEKIDLVKMQLRSAIARRNDDAQEIALREFTETAYGKDTPYGRRIEYATLERIERRDLVEFYRRYFFPANIVLAIYGDFSTAEMKTALEKLFGGWDWRQPAVPAFPAVEKTPRPGVYLAAKTDVNQSFFFIGHLGGVLRDKNFPALGAMADILGGGFSSRLFKKIRTQLGYAYNVGASWGAGYEQPGLFQISGSTQSASTTEALQAALEEVAKIRAAEVSEEELKTATDTVLNGFVFNFDTPGKTLSRLLRYEYHGYPTDFIFQYQKAVGAVSRADVLRVATEYLGPEDFTIVVVGNPKDFSKPLSALGLPVRALDLTIPGAPRDPASLERGQRLLERALKALGGAAKLAAVKDSTSLAEVEILSAGAPIKARQQNRWIAPSHFRQDAELPFGKITTYFDGKSGWLSGPQGKGAMPLEVIKQVEGEMFRLLFRLLSAPGEVNAAGENAFEVADPQGGAARMTLDPATGLPARLAYRMGGQPDEVEEVYDEWMEADGIRLPKKITVNRGGAKFAVTNIREWKLNSGLKVEELSR